MSYQDLNFAGLHQGIRLSVHDPFFTLSLNAGIEFDELEEVRLLAERLHALATYLERARTALHNRHFLHMAVKGKSDEESVRQEG